LKDIYLRTLTGIVFLVIVIGSMVLHPLAFFIVFSSFTFIGLKEFALLAGKNSIKKIGVEYYLFGMLIYFIIGLSGLGYIDVRNNAIIFLIFFLQIAIELFRKEDPSWKNISTYLTGYLYVALPFGLMNSLFYYGAIAAPTPGILIGVFIIIWTSDIFAYLTGSMFGKHRLFERVSPKKSWEGSIGGLLFALIAGYVMSIFVTSLDLTSWLILTIIIVITGTIGDLSESLLKRNAGVKDSGNIFPGHGGVLDRFDAIIFATPFVFIYLNLI
jgi:phosphatidate cytidylyltransferase